MAIPLKRLLGLAFAALVATASPVAAEPLRRGAVDAAVRPWSALGRINAAGASYCSGVLVAPAMVLTAAHCVFDFRNRRWWEVSDISFVAGYMRGEWVATARAKRVIKDETVRFVDRHPTIASVPGDWALIELDAPIGNVAGWLSLASASPLDVGDLVLQVGYRRDRPYAPEMSPPCKVLENGAKGLIFHDCVVPEGGSGSPLLTVEAGALRVVGVHSAQVHRKRTGDGRVRIFSAVVPPPVFAARIPAEPPPAAAAEAARRALLAQTQATPAFQRLEIGELMREIYAMRTPKPDKLH